MPLQISSYTYELYKHMNVKKIQTHFGPMNLKLLACTLVFLCVDIYGLYGDDQKCTIKWYINIEP